MEKDKNTQKGEEFFIPLMKRVRVSSENRHLRKNMEKRVKLSRWEKNRR